MSSRGRIGRPAWLTKLNRIIGRRLRSGGLSTEAALQLCAAVLPSMQEHSPAPAVSAAADVPRRRRAEHRPCWVLERFIGECYRSGDLAPEDALELFDELLPQARPGSVYALTQLLNIVARAPESSAVRDGPALSVSLFNRMARAGVKKVAPDIYTYGVLIWSCCCLGRLDLAFAALGQIFKTGCSVSVITFNRLLNGLCSEKRTSDAMEIVLTRMGELGCMPDVFSFSILLKGLCDERKCQEAVELLHMMADDGGNCRANVVSYSTVIHGLFKEGEVGNAYSLFQEMLDHGIPPNVVTCSSIIDGLCKVQAMDKAEEVLHQMFDKGIMPNLITYASLLHGYISLGQ
ncbi:unnamed protein product [Urochloa humidicola]